MNPEHELVEAYLLLRTAHSAVNHFAIEIVAKNNSQDSISNDWSGSNKVDYRVVKFWETEEQQLETWKRRLLDGQLGIIEWAAVRAMAGKRLPPELLSMIGDILKAR